MARRPPALLTSQEFDDILGPLSKAALLDALWCACQLGTDETPEQIAAQAARHAVLAIEGRAQIATRYGRPAPIVPRRLRELSERPIDSD